MDAISVAKLIVALTIACVACLVAVGLANAGDEDGPTVDIRTLDELRAHNEQLPPPTEGVDLGLKLRVVTYNVHNFVGYPEERGLERWEQYPEGKLALQVQAFGMLDAHIACLQECYADQPLQRSLAERLGYHARFFPGSRYEHCAGALLSRYPVLDCINLTFLKLDGEVQMTRHLGRSLILLPGGQQILVYGSHLAPSAHDELRLCQQIYEIDQALGRPMIWMGDMNIEPTHELYPWFAKIGLVDGFTHLGVAHVSTALKGDRDRGGIDYIFCTPDIADRLQSIEIVNEGPTALDPNDPQDVAASDHLPVLAVFGF